MQICVLEGFDAWPQAEDWDVQAAVTSLFLIHSRWLPGNKILLSVSVIYWPILLLIMLLQFKTGPPFGQEEMSKIFEAGNNVYMNINTLPVP